MEWSQASDLGPGYRRKAKIWAKQKETGVSPTVCRERMVVSVLDRNVTGQHSFPGTADLKRNFG